MTSNMIEIGCGDATARPAVEDVDVRRLTTGELRMLGLARIAYLTASQPSGGVVDFVIHGADGIAVAAVDDLDLALELVDRLGMVLVPVH